VVGKPGREYTMQHRQQPALLGVRRRSVVDGSGGPWCANAWRTERRFRVPRMGHGRADIRCYGVRKPRIH